MLNKLETNRINVCIIYTTIYLIEVAAQNSWIEYKQKIQSLVKYTMYTEKNTMTNGETGQTMYNCTS